MDSGKAVALTLLDIYTTVDMIDHSILHDCLEDMFGVGSTVLVWMNPYLTNCNQKAKLGESFYEAFHLPFFIPQGYLLGPLLFTPFTSPLT